MRGHVTTATILSLSLSGAIAQSSQADFLGFASTSSVVEGDLDTYHVLEVYALFDDSTDRLLNIFDVQAAVGRAGFPGSKVQFLQASDPIEEYPASMLPMGFLPPGEQWVFDTYITIGARQGDFLNGTVADPDFDDATFTTNSSIQSAGWYNLPPTNSYGLAGVEHRVFLGQFVVSAADYQPGLRLEFAATIGYANSGALDFASHSKNFYYGSGLGAPYVDDKIDNDVCSDVIFVNPNSRLVATWLMQGLTRKAGVNLGGQLPSGWRCEATGDLDGNGTADILWRDVNTGRLHTWLLENATLMQEEQVSGPLGSNWTVVGIGDISGDARGDIILRDTSTGAVEAWLMDGPMRLAVGSLGNSSGLVAQGLGDFDGDGLRDILWRTSAGSPRMWLLDGLSIRSQGTVSGINQNIPLAWTVGAIGDLDADSKADIVWRHTSGSVAGWLMNGATRTGSATMHSYIAPQWRVETLRDLNGDGRRDVVWRNSLNGDVHGWLMNGLTRTTSGFIRNAGPAWSMVDP